MSHKIKGYEVEGTLYVNLLRLLGCFQVNASSKIQSNYSCDLAAPVLIDVRPYEYKKETFHSFKNIQTVISEDACLDSMR